jgi:glycosyltransferase involved in cell wall biosynthesis
VRLALWSPHLDQGWPATLAPLLAREARVDLVGEEPTAVPEADVHIYHVADDPAHGFVYRAILERPGLVVLEEWGLHRLVHAETAGRGDEAAYRRELRRAHGETGAFVSRQVLAGLGGELVPLLPVNERVLESSLGVVTATEALRGAAAGRFPTRPVVHLPLGFVGLAPLPERRPARRGLGLGDPDLMVLAIQSSFGTGAPRPAVGALDRLRERAPRAVLVRSGETDPALPTLLAAADVALAVASGTPTLVTAGSGAARELPEGVVARVSPGPTEAEETAAFVLRLLTDVSLRVRMGRVARAFAEERQEPSRCVGPLLEIVRTMQRTREAVLAPAGPPTPEDSPATHALDEVRWAARELGLVELPAGLPPLVAGLFAETER